MGFVTQEGHAGEHVKKLATSAVRRFAPVKDAQPAPDTAHKKARPQAPAKGKKGSAKR